MANHLGQAIRLPNWMADTTLQYYADIFRNVIDHLGTTGKRDSNSLIVQPAGGMNIQVTSGTALVAGSDRGPFDGSGTSLQGGYIVKVDSTVGPLSIAAAPGSGTRTDVVYLSVSDKTEQAGGTNDGFIQVLASTVAVPKSSLVIGTIAVAAGTAAITTAMITQGHLSGNPALVDPNFGYVDKTTTMTGLATPIAAKAFAKVGIGGSPILGRTLIPMTIRNTGFTLPNAAWTAIPFNNADSPIFNAATISDDGDRYQTGTPAGFLMFNVGFYRLSANFGFGIGGGTSVGERGIRMVTMGGSVIGSNVVQATDVGSNSLTLSMPYYWPTPNDTSDPIQVQLYQSSGAAMTIPGPSGTHLQNAVFERIG